MTAALPILDPLHCDPLDLIEQAGADLPEQRLWPKRMAELFDIEHAFSKRQGMNDAAAALDASGRVIVLCDYLGGAGPVYLPRGTALRTAVMHRQLYRRHNGRNLRELAQEYRLCVATVYSILKRERDRDIARRGRLLTEASIGKVDT